MLNLKTIKKNITNNDILCYLEKIHDGNNCKKIKLLGVDTVIVKNSIKIKIMYYFGTDIMCKSIDYETYMNYKKLK